MYLNVELPAVAAGNVAWGYVNRLGHALIAETKIEIGGSKIDEQYGDWLNVWYELSHKVGQERGYAKMIGDVAALKKVSAAGKPSYKMYVPLQFWFNRNNGLALPLIALQYHDVRVTVQLNSWANCVNYLGGAAPAQINMSNCQLLIDYIYLDSEERKRFAQASHEYLIEQLQFTGSESLTSSNNKYRLNFNHPSKYLIWVPHLDRYNSRNSWVAHAVHSGSWKDAGDRFAKVLSLACSSGVTGTNQAVSFVPSAAAVNAGDLVSNVVVPNNAMMAALLAKVDVKFISQDANAGVAGTAVPVGRAQGNQSAWENAIENSFVNRNELSPQDLSNTLAQLQGNGAADSVLGQFVVSVIDQFNYGNFVDGTDNPVYQAKVQLNGHDRFQVLDGAYFNYVQPYQHFSNTPADGVNVYSFALKAEDHQPTGTCNFSRIDNATLQIDLGLYNQPVSNAAYNSFLGANASLLNIYTVNYNVLRVMSGMAGTAYSN